jgi:hypothetical protein
MGPKKSANQKPQQPQQAPAKAEEVKVVAEQPEADAKKKKKKKTKSDDAEPSQPVTEPVDEGWEEVKDSKKEKRNARVERKRLAEAETKAETSEDDYAVVNVPTQSKSEEKEAAPKGKVKGASKPAKKKKVAAKPADVKKPSSAAELVKLITDILENTPSRTQHVPAIGDRIQSLTKQVWSKTYKPQYGTIKDFITSQKDAFHVDESERVSLQKDIQARNAAKAAAQQQAAAKKAAKKEQQKRAPPKEKPKHTDQNGLAASDATDITSLVLKFGLVLALLGGLGFFTAVWVSGGDLKSLGLRN